MPEDVLHELRKFAADRDWEQFHTPANLAKSVSIEAAELLEHFQWDDQFDVGKLADELADVLTYCYFLADRIGVDPHQIMLAKLAKTQEKYPVETARGTSKKYNELHGDIER